MQILDAFCSVTFLVIYLVPFLPTIVDTYLRVFCWVPYCYGTFDYDCSVHCSFGVRCWCRWCLFCPVLPFDDSTVTVVDSLLLLLVFFWYFPHSVVLGTVVGGDDGIDDSCWYRSVVVDSTHSVLFVPDDVRLCSVSVLRDGYDSVIVCSSILCLLFWWLLFSSFVVLVMLCSVVFPLYGVVANSCGTGDCSVAIVTTCLPLFFVVTLSGGWHYLLRFVVLEHSLPFTWCGTGDWYTLPGTDYVAVLRSVVLLFLFIPAFVVMERSDLLPGYCCCLIRYGDDCHPR
jgi:hypothetical protein